MTQNINHYLSWMDDDDQLHTETLVPQTGELKIGRSPHADIEVINTSVSRQHLQLSWQQGHLLIKDLDSSFGTWVNDVRLTVNENKVIYADTEIRLGNLNMWYELRRKDDTQDLMQTCFYPSQSDFKIELSPEINRFRANLQQHLQAHFAQASSNEQLVKAMDQALFELNTSQEERIKEQRILHTISHLLNRSLTLPELCKTALDHISKVLNADRGFIALFEPDIKRFEPLASRNFTLSTWSLSDQIPQNYSQTLVERCYQKGKILIIGDVQLNKSLPDMPKDPLTKIRSIIVIPLQHDEKLVGVIYLDNLKRSHCFNAQQIPFLQTFAAHTAIALHNAQLYKRAITDDLTQLYTRKYIDERLAQEMHRAQRYQRPFSILLLDLDFFKQVNDTYGHNAGDQVLQAFAKILNAHIRDCDIAGRLGGEEFIVILGETDLEDACAFAQRIRLTTEQQKTEKDGQHITITVSIGVAHYQKRHNNQAPLLLEAADKALYQAKAEGRNRVISS